MKVCECGREFELAQSLNAHYRWCLIHREGKEPIGSANKGKTSPQRGKKLEDIVENHEETRRRLRIKSIGRVKSTETLEKLSTARTKYLQHNPPNKNVKFFVVDGIKVQGTWEKRVAERLVEDGVKFKRVQLKYDGHHRYTPDFFLYEMGIYLEVKGWMRSQDLEKYRKVLRDNEIDLRMIQGEVFEGFVQGTISVQNLPKFMPS